MQQRTIQRPLRRKKTNSQIVTYVVLLILVIAFIMTFGVQIVLNASRFIAGFGSKNDDVIQTGSEVVVAPVLYDIPDATNSAKLAISGSSSGDGTVTVFVNDEAADELNVTQDEPDFETTVQLTKNTNQIYAQFKDLKNRVKDSETYVVEYAQEKPALEISSPADGSHTEDAEITVEGKTGENDRVKVNGEPVVMNADGSFSHKITLKQGENSITIVSTDDAGNSEEAVVKVTYEP
jgi:cytoskeletal protein RodZ